MAIESSNDPKKFQSFEREGWELVGNGYENHFSRVTTQAAPTLTEGISNGMKVLDVCTGPGMLASAAIQKGGDVTGVDLSSAMLELARRNVPNCVFEEADAQDLPYTDETFDAVICGLGVIHVPEPERVFTEIWRVLKGGGFAAISTWSAPDADNGFGLLFAALKAHGELNVSLPHGPDIFQFSQESSMADALRKTGFHEIDVTTVRASWQLKRPDEIITALLEGTVRTRALLNAQSKKQQTDITDAVVAAMEEYQSEDGYHVPMPMLVGRGIKQQPLS